VGTDPTGLSVSSTGQITWTPTEAQGPSTNNVTVRVYDNGEPSLSTTNSFIVTVKPSTNAPAPMIQSITLSGSVLTIIWSAVSNRNYMLQSSDDMATTNWNDLPPAVVATGSTATATNAVGAAASRFYRVYLMP
jgi:hypothetical protein